MSLKTGRDLFLDTLKSMDLDYKIDRGEDQTIWFDYHGMNFCVDNTTDARYVSIEYIDIVNLGSAEEMMRMHRVINKVNAISGVVISFSPITVNFRRNVLFIDEIPHLNDYLQSELQELIRAYEMVNDELQKVLDSEKSVSPKNDSGKSESSVTKDLFIKTITEIGCEYQSWEDEDSYFDSIVFKYRFETFRAYFFEYCREVNIVNHFSIFTADLYDTFEVCRLRDAVNKVNQESRVVSTYTIENEANKMFVDCSCTIPFMAEIPQLISYLCSALSQLEDVRFSITVEMEKYHNIPEGMGS